MPILSCQCLNVQVSVQQNAQELKEKCFRFPHQLPDSPDHEFFTEGVHQVTLGICGVTQEVLDLVSNVSVASSSWHVHSCLCCKTATHAIHDDTLTHTVSTRLLDEAQMVALETHPCYSPAFRVVLPPPTRSGPHPPLAVKLSTTLLPATIQKQYSSYITEREALCERRVTAYRRTEQQHLDQDSDKAKQDSYNLLTLLHSLDRLHLTKSRAEPSTRQPQPVIQAGRDTSQDGIYAFSYTPAVMGRDQPLSSTSADLLSQSAAVPRFIRPPELPWDTARLAVTSENTNGQDSSEELNDEDIFLTGYGLRKDSRPSVNANNQHSDDDLRSSDSDLEETVHAAIEDVPDTEAAYGIPGADPAADPSMPPLGKSVPINIPIHKRPVRRIKPDIDENESSDRSGKTPAQMAASILALSRSLHSHYDDDPDAPRPRKSRTIDSPFF